MSIAKDLAQLGKHIAAQHGWPAAKAFKSYEMTDADRATLSKCAVDLLTVFPPVPDSSAMMSAALAVHLESRLNAPVQVVAGTLSVEGVPVFGDRQLFDGAAVFGEPEQAWNGHVWVMVGPYIVDISIFRIAYSAEGPARLSRHVDLVFGPGKGLYVDLWKRTAQQGLTYEPQYVLGAEEVTNLMGKAYHLIQQARTD
ncbi:hypothetical protein WBP06_23270 [Novosphingobium sp. BL-8H]|uniref:hypothetical protein n=1 Tax=Novosphingobium sp. BL-8H TaxID=3127640 RepID=UPI003758493A